ncbi:unnamed protein product [Lasius platythorax]
MKDYSDHSCKPIVDEIKDVLLLPNKKKLKRGKEESDVFYWSHNATLGLLAAYQTIQSNKENVKKHKNFWHDLAEKLQKLGYKVTSDQTRWKINSLIKKYKECVDYNSKSGRSPKSFPYLNEMQDMFGHRKNINCDHTLDSSFFGAKSQSSHSKSEDQQQPLETQILSSSSSSPRQLTSPVKKVKKVHSDSAKTKLELEKQWLEHLRMLSTKNEKENEKLIKIDERNALKKEKLLLKQKQLFWKETVLKRKMENKNERHRDRMRIEREKCQLLKDLIQSKNLFSLDNVLDKE